MSSPMPDVKIDIRSGKCTPLAKTLIFTNKDDFLCFRIRNVERWLVVITKWSQLAFAAQKLRSRVTLTVRHSAGNIWSAKRSVTTMQACTNHSIVVFSAVEAECTNLTPLF